MTFVVMKERNGNDWKQRWGYYDGAECFEEDHHWWSTMWKYDEAV